MKERISVNLEKLAYACPFPLYVVGGQTRDFLAGLPRGTDVDICAPSSAESFSAVAESAGFTVEAVYKNTGTVKLKKGDEEYEFASFRSDEYVRGEHRPANTFFTDDIELDARRRDFKCNAVYYDIRADRFVDPLGGRDDIARKTLTTVAPAGKVFSEDGLRLMRLARIAAQTGFAPSEECARGAAANCGLIADVHAERIYAELDLILHADEKYGVARGHYNGLKILHSTGVMQKILPELCEGDGMPQRSDFHKYDVLEHSLRACAYSAADVRLAALLHDIGKPYCFKTNGNFHGHEREGAAIAAEVCARLKVPKRLAEETVRLVAVHMYDLRGDVRESKVRRFIVSNVDIFDKILALKQADFSASADDFSTAPSVKKLKYIYGKMEAEGAPFSLKELNIRGNALIDMGFPAEYVGKTLENLLNDCASGQVANVAEKLAERARKVYLTAVLRG